MANLTPTPSWDVVPQLETTTPALGGAGGPMNAPQQALLNRTEFLKHRLLDYVTPKQYGAISDGYSHPLSERYDTLEQAKTIYPFATSLTQEIDWAAIQLAVNSSDYVDFGGVGFSYVVGQSVVCSRDDYFLQAHGASIKISSEYQALSSNNTILKFQSTGNIFIDGFTFKGNRQALGVTSWTNYIHCISADTAASVVVNDCVFYDYPSIAVLVMYANYALVMNCSFFNGMYHGINFQSCDDVYSVGNVIRGPGDMGTNPIAGGIGVLATLCSRAYISACDIEDTSDTGTKTEGCDESFYIGNRLQSCGKDGIKVQGYPSRPQCKRAVVQGNQVTDLYPWRTDGSALILVADCEYATVIGNNTRNDVKTTGDANGLRVTPLYASTMRSVVATGNNFGPTIAGTANVVVSNSISGAEIVNFKFIGNYVASKGIIVDKITGVSDISLNEVDSQLASPSISAGTGITSRSVSYSQINSNSVRNFNVGIMIDAQGVVPKSVDVNSNKVIGTYTRAIDIANYGSFGAAAMKAISVRMNSLEEICSGDTASGAIRYRATNLTCEKLSIDSNTISTSNAPAFVLAFNGVGETIGELRFSSNASGSIPLANPWGQATRILGVPKASAPTTGTWLLGDTVQNSVPSAGGTPGWVCTAAGSPGTWKAMASLSA